MSIKKLFTMGLWCISTLSIIGCSATITSPQNNTIPTIINAAGVKSIGQTPFIVAEKMGYFKQEGLELNITRMAGGDQVFKALTTKSMDIGLVGLVPYGFVGLEFPNIKLISVLTELNDTKLITKPSITSTDSLKGKRIGYTKSTASDIFISKLIKNNNLNKEDLTLVNLSPAALPTALASHEIDGYAAREPNIQNGYKLLSGNATIFDKANQKYERYFSLFADESFDKNTTEKILNALKKANSYIQNNPNESKTIMMEFLGMNKETIDSIRSDYTFTTGIKQKYLDALQDIFQRAIEQKGGNQKKIPNISSFIIH